jgi:predicted ATPase/class 3 adenylate cyclase
VRHDLPTGTVTFLFTDVEGSTRLLDTLGPEAYAEALGSHREVIRTSLAEHGGAEVDTQGDAFFCAFGSAGAAVACAQDIQVRLTGSAISVRMGIHTGQALLAGDHYVGLDVHRAARIGACGHGGQIVLSPATVRLLGPDTFAVRDLGEHRLKDLSAPVRLYQLGDADFGALKTLYRTDLPVVATEFLGREEELREAKTRAREPGIRLLTLTGPGGTGKTRFALQLATELADDFPDGVRWVPLAPVRDPALVASAFAGALDVEETQGEPIVAAVSRALGGKRSLVLVDNCEHVVEAVAEVVAALLKTGSELLLLATSREPLDVSGEHVYPVQPLAVSDAVDLFQVRATAAGAELASSEEGNATVAALCARLDNLPLAVELAAARAAVLPPAAMLAVLADRLDLLKGPRDADERQRTLRGAIAWSYDLLDAAEQQLFRRLSVFVGGASLESVEAVCEADLGELLSLVSKSLARQQAAGSEEPRYWMLETIREFAASALERAGEEAAYRDRHLEFFATLARDWRERLVGPGSAARFERLERDRENLRAAFTWAAACAEAHGEDADGEFGERAISISAVLAALHLRHGRYAEAEDVVRTALALRPPAREAALLTSRLGRVLRHQGRWDESLESHVGAERILGLPSSDDDEGWWRAWLDVKLEQAHHHYYLGDQTALASVIEELEPHVDRRGSAQQGLEFLHVVAQAAYRRERYQLSQETETLAREIYRRSTVLEDTDADFTLGFCLLWRDKFEEAQAHLERGLESARARGDALIETRCLVYGAMARRRQGDVEGVGSLLDELGRLEELHGYVGLVAANHAWLAFRKGDLEAVSRFAEEAFRDWDSSRRSAGPTVFQWAARFPMLGVALAGGRSDEALEQARAMLDDFQQPLPPDIRDVLDEAVEREDPSRLAEALELARTTGHA